MTTTTPVPSLLEKIAWSYREVCQVTGLGRTTIHRLVLQGDFPKPRFRGGRRLFVADEVQAWLRRDDEREA